MPDIAKLRPSETGRFKEFANYIILAEKIENSRYGGPLVLEEADWEMIVETLRWASESVKNDEFADDDESDEADTKDKS